MNNATDGSTGSCFDDPVGIVLAGGASSRMGRDKALLEARGGILPALAARRLAAVCAEVAVGPGRGPAAGILGGAAAYPGRLLLVLACDLPRVPPALLAELARPPAADWVIPRWSGGVEPLCALYGPAALAALGRRVERGRLALHALFEEGLAARVLEGDELARFGQPGEIFLNLNTPEDWERYISTEPGAPPQDPQGQISRRKS